MVKTTLLYSFKLLVASARIACAYAEPMEDQLEFHPSNETSA